jgi:hypothetical protein
LNYSAFDYALSKPTVTFRRDGVGGAVHSNEQKLSQQAFETLTRAPMVGEFLGSYSDVKKRGSAWLQFMINDALSLHVNYINLLGYQACDALAFMKEQPVLFSQGLRQMGYRLVPVQIEYPPSVQLGQIFQVGMIWINRGVGRAMGDFSLVFILHDLHEKQITSCDLGNLGTDHWVKGQQYSINKQVIFKEVQKGRYILSIMVDHGDQIIRLPLHGLIDPGSYRVGFIDLI